MPFPRTWTKGGASKSRCMLSGIHFLPHATFLAFVYKAWHVHVCINREPLISQLPNKASLDFTIGNGGHIDPDPIGVYLSQSKWASALMPQRCYDPTDHRRAVRYQGRTITETGKQAKVLPQTLLYGPEEIKIEINDLHSLSIILWHLFSFIINLDVFCKEKEETVWDICFEERYQRVVIYYFLFGVLGIRSRRPYIDLAHRDLNSNKRICQLHRHFSASV